MGRILALDIGEKRTGIAISDPMKIIAQPSELFSGDPLSIKFLEKIKELVLTQDIEKIIVGLPKNLKNNDTLSTKRARDAMAILDEKIDVPILLWDERLTTAQSDKLLTDSGVRWQKKKKLLDKMSAALILDNYLRYIEFKGLK